MQNHQVVFATYFKAKPKAFYDISLVFQSSIILSKQKLSSSLSPVNLFLTSFSNILILDTQ